MRSVAAWEEPAASSSRFWVSRGIFVRPTGGLLADKAADALVESRFGRTGSDPNRQGEARRQLQHRDGTGIAHHDFLEKLAQLFPVARVGGIAAGDELLLESLLRLEVPRLEQGHQVVEFFQAVLHRGGGEHQQKGLADGVDQLPVQRRPVLEVVRFIHNDNVIEAGSDRLEMASALGGLHARPG